MSDPDMVSDRTKIRNRTPFRSLSLGAGVQSTVLALMAERGEYGLPKPDVAVFADTGWEPPSVYEHLDWLQEQLSFEVVRGRGRKHQGQHSRRDQPRWQQLSRDSSVFDQW